VTPAAPPLDFVFTVCDNAATEVCPYGAGRPMTVHWRVSDPVAVEGSDPLDRSKLRGRLGAIGKARALEGSE
jgi:hypothetical protein